MKNIKFNKLRKSLFLAFALCLSMSVVVFGAEPSYDMTAAITTGMSELSTQVFAIIAVVVPAILAILGAKIAITKGISVFKSLVAKG